MHSSKSGYQDGKTVGQVAEENLADLIANARAGSLSAEDPYGFERRQAVTLTLAGGGPGADLTVIFDGDMGEFPDPADAVEGWYTYYEMGGIASVYLEANTAERVYAALTAVPREGDEDEEVGA